MRDWLEAHKWYWFSMTLSFNVFPWHWTKWEKTKYDWGRDYKFGPFGALFIWPLGSENENDYNS